MRFLPFLVPALVGSAVLAQENRLTSARLEGGVLRLSVSGEAQAVRHFPLPGPPRIVVDLFGIDRSVAEMPAPADDSPAFEVRTGEHPGFLRVVVDLEAALPSYQVRHAEGLVEVGLGSAALPPSASGVLIGESPVPDPAPTHRPVTAPVVDVGVETTSAVQPAAQTPVPPVPAAPAVETLQDIASLTMEELLALVDKELAAAGLDLQQSAEELIEQVEAELAARPDRPEGSDEPPGPRQR